MSAKNVLKFIKEKEAEFVDLRFTDPRGKLQHLTMDVTIVDEEMINEGVFFDGSSIAGWKAINESDMILKPHSFISFLILTSSKTKNSGSGPKKALSPIPDFCKYASAFLATPLGSLS